MKVLVTPPKPDFASYIARPETKYIEREAGDSLEALYNQGYLPYSGTKGVQGVFYSARSARVVLSQFVLTSENRRVARKFDGMFEKKRIPIHEFTLDETFYSFVLTYFVERHGQKTMPRPRLELLLASGLITTVVEYRQNGTPAGYVLEVEDGSMRHYWYSAYDLSLIQQSLGLWLMLDCARDAALAGITHYYLGTVYGSKGLYKTNFEPLEWWDGLQWQKGIGALKEYARSD